MRESSLSPPLPTVPQIIIINVIIIIIFQINDCQRTFYSVLSLPLVEFSENRATGGNSHRQSGQPVHLHSFCIEFTRPASQFTKIIIIISIVWRSRAAKVKIFQNVTITTSVLNFIRSPQFFCCFFFVKVTFLLEI